MSSQEPSPATDRPLTEPERRALQILTGSIISASEDYGVPGADDPTIFADILATMRSRADMLESGLEAIDRQAMANHGKGFLELSDPDRETMTRELSRAINPFLRTLMSITAQCYYRDDRVMEALGMAPRAPFPEGYTLEEGDWSLLDPVRERGKLYRDVPD